MGHAGSRQKRRNKIDLDWQQKRLEYQAVTTCLEPFLPDLPLSCQVNAGGEPRFVDVCFFYAAVRSG
jgi:hypothetical protein